MKALRLAGCLAVLVTCSLGVTQPSLAFGPAGLAGTPLRMPARLEKGVNTPPPFAFIRFCVRNPVDCSPGGHRQLAWNPAVERTVMKINRSVNRRIRPVHDSSETWNADVRQGDCEDFALTKRRALVAIGLPAAALRMAVARTSAGEGHAVLVISTDKGDFVLDNRSERIEAWHETDLIWVKIASADDPRLWLKVR